MSDGTSYSTVPGPTQPLYPTHDKTPQAMPVAMLKVTSVEATLTLEDREKQAVEQWVAETIRRKLGPALEKLEKKAGRAFSVSLGVTEARLIAKARQALQRLRKPSRKKKPARRKKK